MDRTIETEEEFRRVFQGMCGMLRETGVIDMNRRTIEARFVDADHIDATYVTEYILAGYKVSEEVVANYILQRIADKWKISTTRFATKLVGVSRALTRR